MSNVFLETKAKTIATFRWSMEKPRVKFETRNQFGVGMESHSTLEISWNLTNPFLRRLLELPARLQISRG